VKFVEVSGRVSTAGQEEHAAFLSCTRSGECLLWEVPPPSNNVQEILQPAKILDIECSDAISYVTGCQVMQGAYLITAISERRQFLFMTKVSKRKKDGSTKSKVKRVDTVITAGEQSHEILYSSVNGDSQVQTVYGNVLQLVASNVNIAGPSQTGEGANEEAAGILKQIELKGM